MFKGTKLYSILFNKCPRCQQGDFFVKSSALTLRGFDSMHERCSNCGLRYEQEPGFFTGSMYISYGLYVALTVSSFLLFTAILDVDAVDLLWGLIPAMVILTPFFFRIARLIWINFFVSYDPTHTHLAEPANKLKL